MEPQDLVWNSGSPEAGHAALWGVAHSPEIFVSFCKGVVDINGAMSRWFLLIQQSREDCSNNTRNQEP